MKIQSPPIFCHWKCKTQVLAVRARGHAGGNAHVACQLRDSSTWNILFHGGISVVLKPSTDLEVPAFVPLEGTNTSLSAYPLSWNRRPGHCRETARPGFTS